MSLFDTNTQADATIDPASFREALGHFASGITIITTQVGANRSASPANRSTVSR